MGAEFLTGSLASGHLAGARDLGAPEATPADPGGDADEGAGRGGSGTGEPIRQLAVDDALPRLVAWGLVDEVEVAAGLEITRVDGRHLNLRIDRPGDLSVLVKQPDPEITSSHRDLKREARFYAFCHQEPRAYRVARWMPGVVACFPEEAALAIAWLKGGRLRWDDPYQGTGAQPLMPGPPWILGRALGTLHATFHLPGLGDDRRLGNLTDSPPDALSLHLPGADVRRRLSPAQGRLLRILQGEAGLCDRLDAARAAWRAETVIHGDVRRDNVLVASEDVETPQVRLCPGDPSWFARVRLVDWEQVQKGDPAWDVGSLLQDAALSWLLGMPQAPDLEAGARVAAAATPLPIVKYALRSLWLGYQVSTGLDGAAAARLLRRSVAHSGARLVQSAWECSAGAERLSTLAVLLLQVAANVLDDPERAARELYGLDEA